jgi:hypothetical protein
VRIDATALFMVYLRTRFVKKCVNMNFKVGEWLRNFGSTWILMIVAIEIASNTGRIGLRRGPLSKHTIGLWAEWALDGQAIAASVSRVLCFFLLFNPPEPRQQ